MDGNAVTSFAIQVDVAAGGTHHMYGSGDDRHHEALALRDGWRDQHPDNCFAIVVGDRPKQLFVLDSRDVRVVEGGR